MKRDLNDALPAGKMEYGSLKKLVMNASYLCVMVK